MSRWKVVTQATVERVYYVDAKDEKRAEAATTDRTSQIETDICEETMSIIQVEALDEKNPDNSRQADKVRWEYEQGLDAPEHNEQEPNE